ncbi:MAG: sodium/proton-translocating pyrophosphatase, partial [Anaerolineae bacterium]|nr:sodium/proton-translocating pyrophosphatase [Anaerolineae bacterium]
LSTLAAVLLFIRLKRVPVRSLRMAEIAGYIAVGVRAYLSRQLRTILLLTPLLAVIVGVFLGPWVAVTFVLGVVTSLATALVG